MTDNKKNDLYKIFHQYAETTPHEKEFDKEIEHSLEKFEKEENQHEQKSKEGQEKIEKDLVLKAEKKRLPLWLELTLNVLIITVLFVGVRTFIFVPFNIDGHSMEGSLHDSEFIYVDKATPYFRDYERGDAVVFYPPVKKIIKEKFLLCQYHKAKNFFLREGKSDPCMVQASFIKRVIGIEGDVIFLKGGHVFLTPKGGKKQEISQLYLLEENKNKTCLHRSWNCQSKATISGFEYPPVPAGKVFVLGDNRMNSSDSRSLQWDSPFVSVNKIEGIARAVFLSPPSSEEREKGFLGIMKNIVMSFSNARMLPQQPVIDEQ